MNFRRDITETKSCVILQAEDRRKAQVIDDHLRRFMWSTHQPWNQDLMAFLCTGGVEVVITTWHLCLLC